MKKISMAQAFAIKKKLNLEHIDEDEFYQGINVELEHGTANPEFNVTNDDLILTGKIAASHLKELPDYYTRLKKMEEDGKRDLDSGKIPGLIEMMMNL